MASYFRLTLDTTAPGGVGLVINNGAVNTASPVVNLAIACTDSDKTGYQMKIWGIDGAATESAATWETYSATKQVTLPTGDGSKTVYVKVRDDVYNESASASDTITLDTSVPEVTIQSQDVQKISKISPKNVSTIIWQADVAITEWIIKVVDSINATHEDGTVVPITGGSTNITGTEKAAATNVTTKIYGADLETASSGDGEKILKIFVKNAAGTWSN